MRLIFSGLCFMLGISVFCSLVPDTKDFQRFPLNPDPLALKRQGTPVQIIQTPDSQYVGCLVDHRFITVGIRRSQTVVAFRNTFVIKKGATIQNLGKMTWRPVAKGVEVTIDYKKKGAKNTSALILTLRDQVLRKGNQPFRSA